MMTSFPVIGTAHAIAIEGDDARRFAQAQFSGDVDSLDTGCWQWNAWLTPVGKVRALMQLVDAGDGRLLMVLRGGDADYLLAQLRRYVLRARAQLDSQRFTACLGAPLPSGQVIAADDVVSLGYGQRSLRLEAATTGPADSAARDAWHLADIHAGWPTLPPGEPEFLPPALGLERLGAIAFDKGCYPGQEIAARLHFRGGHKRRLCHLQGSRHLPSGAALAADGSQAWVLDAAPASGEWHVLAVLSDTIQNKISILNNIYRVVSSF